jgi:hypothetical protein
VDDGIANGGRALKSINVPTPGRCSSRRELESQLVFMLSEASLRHRVAYSNAAYHDFHRQAFSTQKEAIEFAERILKSYNYVWISEFGKYQTKIRKWS